jgi:hypothetical protein
MRYLITLLFAALSFNAVGQGIPQLPYNPDATGDEFIGSPDLLELLSLYGEEFSSAILSEDQESAIVYMGNSDIFSCRLSCSVLPGNWWLMTMNEAGLVVEDLESIAEGEEVWIENIYSTNSYPLGILRVNGSSGLSITTTDIIFKQNRCYCATKELPKVEYSYCSGGTPDSESFVGCINEKLTEGWYPLSGWPIARDRQGYVYGPTNLSQTYGSQTHASFWRWAD